jgi:hypothetical protein
MSQSKVPTSNTPPLTTSSNDWNDTSTERKIVNDAQQTTDITTVIVISGIASLIILLLIIIVAVQIRGKREKGVAQQEDSGVQDIGNHVDTYCEIDDTMVSSTSENNRKSNVGKYELIKESGKEKTKYTTLPSGHTSDRNSYITLASISMETTGSAEKGDPSSVNMEPDNTESQMILRKASTNRNLNLPAMPDGLVVSKSISGYIDMTESEKRDEYVAMEDQSKVSKNSGHHK